MLNDADKEHLMMATMADFSATETDMGFSTMTTGPLPITVTERMGG